MSTIYTCVHECGKGEKIVLNRNYTKEQIREKLSVPEAEFSKSRIDEILSKGIYLDEILTIECNNEGTITTQCRGSIWYFYKRDKVIIGPDGSFKIIEYIPFYCKVYYWIEELLTILHEKLSQKTTQP